MLIATAAVTLIPLTAIWGLRSLGATSSPWVCVPLAVALSLAVSAAGSAYWKRRRPAPELLFSELLLWSWLRRRRSERLLEDASRLLEDAGELSAERRARLLSQLASSLEAHDPYTIGHSRRVARHSAMLARRLGLSKKQTRKVRTAAAIHDVGKLHVSSEVLNKPGKLTDSEYELIKLHAAGGGRLAAGLGDDELTAIVRHHHERLDGSGYPDGLAGEQIPFGARIVAVADTFDAITSVRPYRPARAHRQAIDILRKEAGQQLDGSIVEAFIACYAGQRAVAAWATLSAAPQTALAALGGGTKQSPQVRISPSRTFSSGAAVAAIAGLAIAAPISVHHHRHHHAPAPTAAVFAAAPSLRRSAVKPAHPTRRVTSPASPFSPVITTPTSPPVLPPTIPTPRKQTAKTPKPPAQIHTPTPNKPHTISPTLPPTTTTIPTVPPPATSITTTATPTTTTVSVVSLTPGTTTTTSTTSTTSTETTTTTTEATTTSTPTVNGDPCKNGGYVGLGSPNQGQCVSGGHGHHGH